MMGYPDKTNLNYLWSGNFLSGVELFLPCWPFQQIPTQHIYFVRLTATIKKVYHRFPEWLGIGVKSEKPFLYKSTDKPFVVFY